MVKLIFDCNCKTCDGGIPSGTDELGNPLYGGSLCVCYCHTAEDQDFDDEFLGGREAPWSD
jgi:hypothetical protein